MDYRRFALLALLSAGLLASGIVVAVYAQSPRSAVEPSVVATKAPRLAVAVPSDGYRRIARAPLFLNESQHPSKAAPAPQARERFSYELLPNWPCGKSFFADLPNYEPGSATTVLLKPGSPAAKPLNVSR